MKDEVWKDIKGYKWLYQISSHGNVKSIERRVASRGGSRLVRERILKPSSDKDGYLQVNLSKNGITKTLKIHRLAGECFLDNPDKNLQINHIDGDKTNNYHKNLEYVVNLKNTNHYHSKNGTKKYGVHMSQNKWRARIKKDGKSICLGHYSNKETAYKAFFSKYVELHGVKPW